MPADISHVSEEIDTVLDHRVVDNKVEYLLQWTSDGNKTWEADTNLTECDQALSLYWNGFIQKNPNHSYLIPQIVETAQSAEDEVIIKSPKRTKTTNKKKAQVVRKATSRSAPEDRIAVAKRVQMNKQLSGARSRVAAPVSKTAREPPARSKRVEKPVSSDEEDIEMSPSPPTKVVQRARKSTGRRALPIDLNSLRYSLPDGNTPEDQNQ
ncbi:hypothetical protein LPJ53_004119 [Coemansia erecta]|uniref:Chromo domain-containing protein n=1 Tax=Coemansia erecta TaxID=147472 RepID=A0A9W7XYH2_9FUNG|nr:hypothetical protein LPJ53_004119 [Coemansia erecta]